MCKSEALFFYFANVWCKCSNLITILNWSKKKKKKKLFWKNGIWCNCSKRKGTNLRMSARTHIPTPILTRTIFHSSLPLPHCAFKFRIEFVATVRTTHPHSFTSKPKKKKNGMPFLFFFFLISLFIISVC